MELKHTKRMGRRKLIAYAQIALIAIAVIALAWTGARLFEYYQAQQGYRDLSSAYSAEQEDGCPVDLAKLMRDYPEIVGWIVVDDLDLSYPVMQGDDNEKYLHVDFRGEPSIDGSIFLDYRDDSGLLGLGSIVYGHNMADGSMFGKMQSYLDESFYRSSESTFVYYTLNGAFKYRIFAIDIVNPDDEIYQTGFKDPKVFDAFVKGLKERSMYDTGVDVTGNDRIMTLSTCSGSDRLVVTGKQVGANASAANGTGAAGTGGVATDSK